MLTHEVKYHTDVKEMACLLVEGSAGLDLEFMREADQEKDGTGTRYSQ